MKIFTVSLVFISFLVILNSSVVMAQEGASKIQGKVTDATTGEPLYGTNVILVGTSLGAATGNDGNYQITNVPPGIYTIQFTYIGYKAYKAENINVLPGKTLELNAKLTIESVEGQTIVVTAQKQGQIGAINQQLNSNSIKNIVAKDYIQAVPDMNAAESIGRLPGVSIIRSGGEGDKIVIRGLSPQYNNIEIDGVKLTGTDLDRSVGLSNISNEMLEGIVLSKTLTPDMDADALGGTVNLTLKEAAEGLHFNALAQGTYNDIKSDLGNYKFSGRISNRFLENSLGVIANFGTEKINRSSDNFGGRYATLLQGVNKDQQVLQTQNADVTQYLDDRYRSFGDIILDYKTDFMKLKMDNLISQQIDKNQRRQNLFIFTGSEFDFNIYKEKPIKTDRTHSLSGVFSFWNTELNLEGAYTQSRWTNYRDNYNFRDQDLIPNRIPTTQLTYNQPSALITKYYDISEPTTSILWSNTLTNTKRKDETYTYNANWKIPYKITEDISGYIKAGGRFSDKHRNNGVDELQAPYYGGRGIQFVSTLRQIDLIPGLLYNTDVGIGRADGIPAVNWTVLNYDWQNILDGRYNLGYSQDLDKLDAFSHAVYNYNPNFLITNGVPTYQNSYVNNERKTAAYIMTELRIGGSLMLLPGVRYEKFHSEYSAFFIQTETESPTGISYAKPISANNDNEFWFPSVNVKYNVNDWSDIRAAYFRSCTRPDYRLLSPGALINEARNQMYLFNWTLQPATANNFDLMYSVHNNEIGLLSINGFYKEIDGLLTFITPYQPQYFDMVKDAPAKLIEELQAPRSLYDPTLFKNPGIAITPQAGYPGFPVNNPTKTYFRGIELNWETNFWYLPGLLSSLVLDVNYSRIWSSTQFPYLSIENIIDTTGTHPKIVATPFYHARSSRMLNQPSDILNVRVGWDYEGFSTRISFRYQGEVLTAFDPQYSLQDSYSKAQFLVDWTVKQKLYDNLYVLADVSNLNQYIDDSFIKTGNYSFPTSSTSYGFLAQIGLRYEY